jgi:hypothetical protein
MLAALARSGRAKIAARFNTLGGFAFLPVAIDKFFIAV